MKKSVKWLIEKIPHSRACAAELFSVGFRVSFNRMLQEISHCGVVVSALRKKVDDIHEEISQSNARLTSIERWLYVITFSLIAELFLLIVLMFI